MIKLYLNSQIRKKELQIIVQPSKEFVIEDCVPISFVIFTKEKYFQDFMENEIIKNISKNNFHDLIKKYTLIYENYQNKHQSNKIIFSEGNEFSVNTFYINKSYIEVTDIVKCCELYVKHIKKDNFTLYLYEDVLLYQDNKFYNLDVVNNHVENNIIESYILEKEQSTVNYTDIVKLFIIEKWIHQEKPKYRNRNKKIEDYFIESKEGYFTFDDSENKEIEEKIINDIKLKKVLYNLYGQDKTDFLLKILTDNPFKHWKF